MDKEIDNLEEEEEEDFNIDELLSEEEDNPVEEVTEEQVKSITKKSKGRGRPKGTTKKKETNEVSEVPVEIAETDKDLDNMEWQSYSQQAFDGFQNLKTGEIIDDKEALRRTLNYAQEAARNSR